MDINQEIATKVMGWELVKSGIGIAEDHFYPKNIRVDLWKPSDNIDQAFEVVEKMHLDDYWFSLVYKSERVFNYELKPEWFARFRCVRGGTRPDLIGTGDMPQNAICNAAKKYVSSKITANNEK